MGTLTNVVVLLKGGHTILVFILIKIRLHISNLDAGFVSTQLGVVHSVAVLDDHHILGTKAVGIEALTDEEISEFL